MQSMFLMLIPPDGRCVWAAPPGCDFVSVSGQMISKLCAYNEGQEAGNVQLVRDGDSMAINATDGIRWAYRDRETIVGDMEIWAMLGHTPS